MHIRASRTVLIACAGATVLAAVLVLALRPHVAHPGFASSAHGQASNGVPQHKPSPYGEAFKPGPPVRASSLNSAVAIPTRPAGNLPPGDFAGQHYPSVAPGVMAANLISAPPPSYPFLARLAHVEGRVTVQAFISRDGVVSATRVLDGHHLLRGAAVAAVRLRRYRPYRVGGQPINVATTVTVDFHPPS
jgi:TonB family protein